MMHQRARSSRRLVWATCMRGLPPRRIRCREPSPKRVRQTLAPPLRPRAPCSALLAPTRATWTSFGIHPAKSSLAGRPNPPNARASRVSPSATLALERSPMPQVPSPRAPPPAPSSSLPRRKPINQSINQSTQSYQSINQSINQRSINHQVFKLCPAREVENHKVEQILLIFTNRLSYAQSVSAHYTKYFERPVAFFLA